jgi:hypothetical protein
MSIMMWAARPVLQSLETRLGAYVDCAATAILINNHERHRFSAMHLGNDYRASSKSARSSIFGFLLGVLVGIDANLASRLACPRVHVMEWALASTGVGVAGRVGTVFDLKQPLTANGLVRPRSRHSRALLSTKAPAASPLAR